MTAALRCLRATKGGVSQESATMRSELIVRGATVLMKATFVVATVVLGIETPALADWQYTQWGMSPAEVQAASNGTAVANQDRRLDADDLTAGLTAFYRGDKRPFTAVFLFDTGGKLSAVNLNPTDRISCDPIRQFPRGSLRQAGIGRSAWVRADGAVERCRGRQCRGLPRSRPGQLLDPVFQSSAHAPGRRVVTREWWGASIHRRGSWMSHAMVPNCPG